SRCQDSYTSNPTEVTGHTEVIDSAVPATCTTTGLTEGKHCSVCNTVLVAQTTVDATGHAFDDDFDINCNNNCGFVTAVTVQGVHYAQADAKAALKDVNVGDNVIILANATFDQDCAFAIANYVLAPNVQLTIEHDVVVPQNATLTVGSNSRIAVTNGAHINFANLTQQQFTTALTSKLVVSADSTVTMPAYIAGHWATPLRTQIETMLSESAVGATLVFDGQTWLLTDDCWAHSHFEADWTQTTAQVDNTCLEDGHTAIYTCSICGETKGGELLEKTGHFYVRTEVVSPSCAAEGYTRYECVYCDDWYKESILAKYTDHRNYWEIHYSVPATCLEAEHIEYYCSICCLYLKEYIGEPLDHKSSWEIGYSWPSFCGSQGYTTYWCSICNMSTETVYVEPTHKEHNYVVQSIPEPSCLTVYIVMECTNCGMSVAGDRIPSDPNAHKYEAVETVAPTCQDYGYTTYRCSICYNSYAADIVDPTGEDCVYTITHTPGDCVTRGTDHYLCTICGDSFDVQTVALGHIFEKGETVPVGEYDWENGYTIYHCTRD
ncbi:MAG: hypothetical protein J6Q55_01615, partial [Clostridia bacterium]|nr:hypothetical protein [Clostridia bacterium]